jgi:hypothetical protein
VDVIFAITNHAAEILPWEHKFEASLDYWAFV